MDLILDLFASDDHDAAAGESVPARRLHRATAGVVAALVIAALWGAAAGSVSARLAAANLYKVPMVLLLAILSAVPAGLLAWRTLGGGAPVVPFLTSLAKGVLDGALVLGATAPLVALYSHTSSHVGPLIATVSVAAALALGFVSFTRSALAGAASGERLARLASVGLSAVIVLAAALQLNVLAAPILPEPTAFAGGIDGLRGALGH
jgi:hypothetical protein